MSYREKYNRIGSRYDILEVPLNRYFEPLREKAVKRVSGKVLEIGVGTGKTLKYYPRNVELYAIDGSEEMLKVARERAKSLGINAKFIRAEAENLPFPNDFFDYVVSSFVFCTVPNPERAMKEIVRVLKPGGGAIFLEHTLSDSTVLNLFFLMPLELILSPLLDDSTTRETHKLVRKFLEVEKEESYYRGIVRLIVARKPF
ncbi:class I SAM-dependent methyltransferase [Pyrococcus abyssi]|uniref:UbiE ubiquinone/menaquinone biosynthesis methyltransferase n=1 Tax=Pyrococcus abyssi (strain GE5 / Orsay) TaxID=272844 RepID=Q9V094_PYRAB|nr:class I SAM-dependent methyltransferase [Pyrococcus abyssi]CAB49811.1 ubiE ubiquinone/menaquinone biosynthesis methyltransferase [Pyrococcus abyssi GE5]CCE70304.1 TPA: ubiquinone/menaquinone biosynthesis methyl transferase [Pyrococcus abyssi GE5]